MRTAALAAILASTTILSGCAGTIAGVSLSSISSFAGFASTIFTGADLGEHAASLVTGKNCRFSEGLVREDRKICEDRGSAATREDFHGIFVERIDSDGTVVFAAPKYMTASVGAGENENNTDVIWAQIKAQKAQEEVERQLARAENNQQIDVAALASGSLSSESLSFLPVGMKVSVQGGEDEPASQTAARPRDFSNAAQGVANKNEVKTVTSPQTSDSEQPAIDEKSFTASMQIAHATGEGGPFIAATTNSTPVVSTLVNGEPVLVMQIGPVISPLTSAPSDHFSAMPLETPPEEIPTMIAQAPSFAAEPTSPQALISSLPKTPKAVPVEAPAPAIQSAPSKPAVKPKSKPAPVETAAAPTPKLAKPKTAPTPVPTELVDEDVYQPPTRDAFSSPAPDLTAPSNIQVPAPAEPAPHPIENTPSATSGPAPLIPMAQP